MALELTEYAVPQMFAGQSIGLPGTELATQSVAIGASSAASSAFNAATRVIVVWTDTDCRIAIGKAPVAANSGSKTRRLIANSEYAFVVGGGDKIAAIAA